MKRIKIGVIPAAGSGKRLGYISSILPKPLFPLYDRPIIHHIVDNMKNVGIEEIYIPVSYQKEKIIKYFDKNIGDIGIDIHFIKVNTRPTKNNKVGLAMSIYSAKEFIQEPFMTILGDDCTIAKSLDNIVETFFDKSAIVVEGMVKDDNIASLKRSCCIILDGNDRIDNIIEKPDNPPTNIRGCGIYMFDNKIFDYIENTPISHRKEVEITQTIDLISKAKRAYGSFIDGANININTYDDLLDAWIEMKKMNGATQWGQKPLV